MGYLIFDTLLRIVFIYILQFGFLENPDLVEVLQPCFDKSVSAKVKNVLKSLFKNYTLLGDIFTNIPILPILKKMQKRGAQGRSPSKDQIPLCSIKMERDRTGFNGIRTAVGYLEVTRPIVP